MDATLDRERVAALVSTVRGSLEPVLTRSPIDDAPLARVPQSSGADVAEAFRRARVAQAAWSGTSVAERAALLLRLHDLVLDHRDELTDLVILESGKARRHAFEEIVHVALTCRYYARTGPALLRSGRAAGIYPVLTRVDLHRVPKGVVGVISPWNYPLTMAVCDGIPALLAGNAVIAKPDAQTMLTPARFVELLEDAGAPEDLWQLVAGPGPEVGGAVAAQADHVCLTGSAAAGRAVAAVCADRLVSCSLELGGKNPMLVLADADVERAADGAVRAAFSNTGQMCVAVERIYVDAAVHDDFVGRFLERTRALRLGDPRAWSTDVGTLTSAAQLRRVTAHVEDAVGKGAAVLAGGRPRPDLGPYAYEPTILAGVTREMACFGEETFGPVVSVGRVSDAEEAVTRANDGDYGLNGAVYGRDTRHARAVAARLRCGTVNVNEAYAATFGSIEAPMGGMRESGLGRRQGAEGLLRFTETQAVATQRGLALRPLLGMGEERFAGALVAALRVMRRTRRR